MNNPHKDYARRIKAEKIATWLEAHRVPIESVERAHPTTRMATADAAGCTRTGKPPSDTTWNMVVSMLRDHAAAREQAKSETAA